MDHPFKRRRRRCNLTTTFLSLFAAVSTVTTAFAPVYVNLATTPFRKVDSFVDATIFQQNRKDRRHRRRFGRLWGASKDVTDASSSDGKSYPISPEQLNRIKDSVDIVSVIESYGLPKFQRHGTNRAKAICPFHDDHNPSMSVDGQRGIYKCFSCGAGGDVFNFVREYNALQKNEPMTFYQAVKHVAQEFGDPSLLADFGSSSSSRLSDEERKALNEKRKRLLLANAAAAAFYGKCLVTVPAAGAARSHLQERGLSATTVKTFALGYAPDGYFREKGEWGKGSLVEHLRNLGFRPSEMIEAGLATRTKGTSWKKSISTSINKTMSVEVDDSNDDFSTLIDRFRNRLMVPIFDSRGANVLGFGARILPPEETDTSGYKAPKYINSPESPVFHKKNVLFGQHYASEAIRDSQQAVTVGESDPDRGSVVIVEGYMDAILLYEASIQEVMASMGTALTMEQLTSAARTAGTHGGRIILCFDGDEAGVNAIERLCTGSILARIAETYVVEILVATLPSGVKDPGEYIESKSSKTKSPVGALFRKEVINTAKDWTAWYLDRLLSRYDDRALRGSAGSFGDICDRISEFLSAFQNPPERTKRAHDVAGRLADVVSGSSDSGEGSNALRIQLETDLVNMVARKAGARESIERRIESVEGYSPDGATSQKLAKITQGDGVNRSDNLDSRLSSKALRALKKTDPPKPPKRKKRSVSRRSSFDHDDGSSRYGRRRERARMRRPSSKKIDPPSFTPHFSGFEFENPTDLDWLKLPREKWKRKKKDLTLGTTLDGERFAKAKATRSGEEHVSDLLLGEVVYFNSNEYHGQQFVTQDAVDAGYTNVEVARDASIFEHGVGTLVRQDAHVLVDAAEEKLLRNIIKYSRARRAMVHSLATSEATGSMDQIEWSHPERAWLFERLVEQSSSIPGDILEDGKANELRLYLGRLPDAPAGAFGVDETTKPTGDSRPTTMNTVPHTHIEIDRSASHAEDEVNVPSDGDDIESWAASYDPSMFEDEADSIVEQQSMQEAQPLIEAELIPDKLESVVEGCSNASLGSLDGLFVSEEDYFADTYDASVSRELRAELEVQEAHASLLRAAALKKFAAVKSEWLTVGELLASRLEQENATAADDHLATAIDSQSVPGGIVGLDSMSIDGLEAHYVTVGSTLRDIAVRVYQLDVSARRICSRLLDYSNVDGIEGRISVAQQEELASSVDTYLDSLPENWQAPANSDDSARFHNNRDPFQGWGDDMSLDRAESFEEDMNQIDSEWGEWADDDFVWTPKEDLDSSKLSRGTGQSNPTSVLDKLDVEARLEEDDEPLEDALKRIDSEWASWDDEIEVATDTDDSDSNGIELDGSDDEVNVDQFLGLTDDSIFE